MHAPWAVSFPSQPDAKFHFVASGSCWQRTQGSEWLQLRAGDAVLLPRGHAHVLASSPDVPDVDINALGIVSVTDTIYLVGGDAAPAQPPSHVMFCGGMQFNLDPLHPLLAMMPEVIRAGDLAQRDPTVPVLLDAMEREVELNRVGACGVFATGLNVPAVTPPAGSLHCAVPR
jgi:hypothetical protein